MVNKILIIDDDKELCSLIKKCLEQENFIADTAHTGIQGLIKAQNGHYSLIILDVMLPEMDGFTVLTKIREAGFDQQHPSAVPILMLTAKTDEINKVSGLRLGADDYLTKPFNIDELMARVASLIRRNTIFNQAHTTNSLQFTSMKIDAGSRTVHIDDALIDLTAKEFDMLFFLASEKNQVFTKKQIFNHVWKEEYAFDDDNVMSFISKLRKKIEIDQQNPFYILTVRGVGYRFNKDA